LLIPIKDLQDYPGFSNVEDETLLLIAIMPVTPTRECRGVRIHGTSSKPPLDVPALVLILGLGNRRMQRQHQLPCLPEEADVLVGEKDIHANSIG